MSTEKQEVKNRLKEILKEVGELGSEANDLIDSIFPEQSEVVAAYGLCIWGTSANPYSDSLEKVVEELEV